MKPIEFIRRHVFRCKTQVEFARRIGVVQRTISLWECKDGAGPNNAAMGRIRQAAMDDKLTYGGQSWRDEWFFEVPDQREPAE